jgi:hypothetical protein
VQSVRAHASRLVSELETAVQSSGEADNADDSADGASYDDNDFQAIGPLHAQPFSDTTGLGSTAAGVGWGGKSQVRTRARLVFLQASSSAFMCASRTIADAPLQSELFHTMSEHEPPNDITLPPQVRSIPRIFTQSRVHG